MDLRCASLLIPLSTILGPYLSLSLSRSTILGNMHVALLFHVLFLLEMRFSSLMVSCNLITMKERENPSPFPSDFLFGTASSAYQVL